MRVQSDGAAANHVFVVLCCALENKGASLFILFVYLRDCLFACLCVTLSVPWYCIAASLPVVRFAVNNTQPYIGPHPFLPFFLPSATDHSLLSACCLLTVNLRIFFPWTFPTDEAVARCNKMFISKQSPNKDNRGESSPFVLLVVVFLLTSE